MAQSTVQRYTAILGLSSSQQEEAFVIFTAEETTDLPIRQSEKLAHDLLKTAIEANDTASIARVSILLGQLSGQKTTADSTAKAQLNVILTSDQQTRFARMLDLEASGGPGGFAGPGSGQAGPPFRR